MSEELNQDQIDELSRALGDLEASLQAALEQVGEGAQPVDLDQPIGRLSRMDAMQQQAMASANKRATELRLRMVRGAMASVGRGDYGECRRCEEPIGYQRLSVKPESPYCLDCQRSSETA